MSEHLLELRNHSDLLRAWTLRTIKSRYQQSLLGGLWAIVQPAASAIIFSVLFTYFIPVNTGNVPYLVFAYSALVPWTFMATALVDMVDSLVVNMSLVSKIYFPREILPMAGAIARVLDLLIAGSILAALLIFFRTPTTGLALLLLPFIILVQLLLVLGLGLAGAALNVFYRDVRHVIALGLQVWFYATPIVYPPSVVPQRIRPLYDHLNPMTGLIQAYRGVLLGQEVSASVVGSAVVMSLAIFVAGYWLFKKVEPQFADVV